MGCKSSKQEVKAETTSVATIPTITTDSNEIDSFKDQVLNLLDVNVKTGLSSLQVLDYLDAHPNSDICLSHRAKMIKVFRDKQFIKVPQPEIVPKDIVVVKPGKIEYDLFVVGGKGSFIRKVHYSEKENYFGIDEKNPNFLKFVQSRIYRKGDILEDGKIVGVVLDDMIMTQCSLSQKSLKEIGHEI